MTSRSRPPEGGLVIVYGMFTLIGAATGLAVGILLF